MSSTIDPTEHVKHQRYKELLADEMHRPIEDVEPVYDDVMMQLKEAAQITDFVPIFAWRRTRALLSRS